MISPKLKAKELFDKYYYLLPITDYKKTIEKSKQCALIAVKNEYHSMREMLIHFQATKVINDEKFYLKFLQKLIDEEQEVKQEIRDL
jgi:hypothetical protein